METNFRKYSEFLYWFEFSCKNNNKSFYNVYKNGTIIPGVKVAFNGLFFNESDSYNAGENFSIVQENSVVIEERIENAILSDFKEFTKRPEFSVGLKCHVDLDKLEEIYKRILLGVKLIVVRRNNKVSDPDHILDKMSPVFDWLDNTDFFVAPASTRYHGDFEHGLVIHHLDVYNMMMEVATRPIFSSNGSFGYIESCALVALVHDWCKINCYKKSIRNRKNEQGKWEQYDAYEWDKSNDNIHLGHGVSSLWLAETKLHYLTKGEAEAIRWHMGQWDVSNQTAGDLRTSNSTNPLTLMLQFADNLACTAYENNPFIMEI